MVTTVHGYSILKYESRGGSSALLGFGDSMDSRSLRASDAVVCVGDAIRDHLVDTKGVDKNKVFIIHDGVDPVKFQKRTSGVMELRKRLRIPKKTKVVVFAKSLYEVNGIRTLIKSVPDILKHDPNLLFLILGKGDLEQEMKEYVKRAEVGNQVIFTGLVRHSQMPIYLSIADVFCVPFTPMTKRTTFGVGDTLGIAHLEAMACEVPTISTKKGIRNGKYGTELQDSVVVVAPGDSKGLLKAIIKLLSDPDFASKIGSNGRKTVKKHYSIAAIYKKYISLYKNILK